MHWEVKSGNLIEKPFLQELFLVYVHSTCRLNQQISDCQLDLYKSYIEPATQAIRNLSQLVIFSPNFHAERIEITSPRIIPWFMTHWKGSLVDTTPMSKRTWDTKLKLNLHRYCSNTDNMLKRVFEALFHFNPKLVDFPILLTTLNHDINSLFNF